MHVWEGMTRQAMIDGAVIASRAELHNELASQLALPWWYGRNLDALYDCLVDDLDRDVELHLVHMDALSANLGTYADMFQTVLRDAGADNPRLRIVDDDARQTEKSEE